MAPQTSGTFPGAGNNVYTITQVPGGITSQPTVLHHHQLTSGQSQVTARIAPTENITLSSPNSNNNNSTASAAATAAAIALTNLHNNNTNHATGVTQTTTNTAVTGMLANDGNKTLVTNSSLPSQPQQQLQQQTVIIHTPVGATTGATMDETKLTLPTSQQQLQQTPTHLMLSNGRVVALSSDNVLGDMAQAISSLGNLNGSNIIISLPSSTAAPTPVTTVTGTVATSIAPISFGAVKTSTTNIPNRPIDMLTNAAMKVVVEPQPQMVSTPIVSIVTSNVNNNPLAVAGPANVCVATGNAPATDGLENMKRKEQDLESNDTKKFKVDQ